MLVMTWTWIFIGGLIAIGFFVALGWTLGAHLVGALLALMKRGG